MFSQVIIAILVVLLSLVFIAIYRRAKNARRGILLTGLCDTGKTLLYARLIHRKFVNTQTSIKENIGDYVVNGSYVRVIDIPGHERIRGKFFEDYKSQSRGIVYVIDSQTIQKDVRDAAEFLYNILVDPVVVANRPAVLVLCNKQDQPLVKSASAVKAMLEKEMNTLRVTKSKQLQSVDPNHANSILLGGGDLDEPFTFDSMGKFKVDFAESHATNSGDADRCSIDELQSWLAKIS
ncbi:PREDICTED: signal recognition particle receptor subunit beta [Nicrophorus vespilloides]|uniref:Signal recognition particle receptor subunit beta n=1 Tax=Nicrophorus vespilloides TaxID=110193 RepID=A0ABM1NED4_NICVS|nr:PREDICTED: signal recognition particle receptor subunit beta [Nicrophorus vespilloides]